jgi:hypothetical protein
MKKLRRLFYLIFPHYKRTDYTITTWAKADQLIRDDPSWKIAPEDAGLEYPMVALEKRKRIEE